MKITVTSQPIEQVSAQAVVVLHESGGLLAESSHPALARHFSTFVRDVDSKTCRREWFCTLDKDSGCRTHHLLLDSVTFSAAAPLDEPLKMTAARCVALCREYSLSKIAFVVHHKVAALKAAAILEGILLGDFRDTRFKGTHEKRPDLTLTFVVPAELEKEVRLVLEARRKVAVAQNHARALINAPHNVLTPAVLVAEAVTVARKGGMKSTVLNEKQLRAKGYELTWQVGRGSEYPPRQVTLEYSPAKVAVRDHVVLVGKGMTFDSGGLCLKGRDSIYKMNGDMGGAAAVIGAMEGIAALKLPVRVSAVIGSAHNAVDGAAYYPGCIVKARNGKTVHIENTDAEGRLILADCFSRAGELKPDIMIDLATLTGAAGAALGSSFGALFTDDEVLRGQLLKAGGNTGDELWPLPLVREYETSLRHHLADLNNMSSDKSGGGAIHAANFLRHFVPEGVRWAHLDIAGVAQTDRPKRYFKTGGTGFGVRLLVEYLRLLIAKGG
ncbi:aminopeptidase [bacterium]|nr:aminopeptidase [bacterium]